MPPPTLDWLDRKEYPFGSHWLDLPMGRMHYVDEGRGPPIVMVHGNPSWSFVYRHLIKGLSDRFRCVAMDHIGFGLSDKPYEWSYLPKDHAANVRALIEHLGLEDVTMVGQDWGGPTGFSYAVERPDNVRAFIIMNTWMWSVKGDPHYERFSSFVGGPFGRFLIKRFNFFVNRVMKMASGDRSWLTKHIHDHYRRPLSKARYRKGCWVFPGQVVGSHEWLEQLWSGSGAIKDKPALLLWGMKDIAFRENELDRWADLFSNRKVVRFEDAGHFVQEEKGPELPPIIREFLSDG